MFEFLKKKIGNVIRSFSKKVEEETPLPAAEAEIAAKAPLRDEPRHEKKEEPKHEGVKATIVPAPSKKDTSEEKEAKKDQAKMEQVKKTPEIAAVKEEAEKEPEKRVVKETDATPEPEQRKRSVVSIVTDRITKQVLSAEKFESLFWELEVALLENNVALEVIEKIKDDLGKDLVGQQITRGRLAETIQKSLMRSIRDLFPAESIDLVKLARKKKPLIIAFVGVNGAGKTTTIAKVAKMLLDNKLKCVFAASDTFRAASQEQIDFHAKKLGVKLIKHDYGADPAAVAFDAIKYAEAHGIDAVLIDTAGRLHSNTNLMDELRKVVRVAKPDLVIFIGESITGNDCIEQAREFDKQVGISGIILTKADVDSKGGAAISVSYITKKPIMYLGVGQGYEDLREFSPDEVVSSLGMA